MAKKKRTATKKQRKNRREKLKTADKWKRKWEKKRKERDGYIVFFLAGYKRQEGRKMRVGKRIVIDSVMDVVNPVFIWDLRHQATANVHAGMEPGKGSLRTKKNAGADVYRKCQVWRWDEEPLKYFSVPRNLFPRKEEKEKLFHSKTNRRKTPSNFQFTY